MTPLSFYFGGKLKETLSLFLNTGKQMGNAHYKRPKLQVKRVSAMNVYE